MNRLCCCVILSALFLHAADGPDAVRLPAGNYVVNGGFERGEEGWSHFVHRLGAIDRDICFAGSASFRMTGLNPERHGYFWQYNVPLRTGRVYTLSASIRSENLDAAVLQSGVLFLTNYGWTDAVSLGAPSPTCDWTRVHKTFTAFATSPRPDGQPTYNLVVYRAPGTSGTVWVDNVQIEEGPEVTPFRDVDLKPGLEARTALQDLDHQIEGAATALDAFRDEPAHASLAARLQTVRTAARDIREDLARYADLPRETREALPTRAAQTARTLGAVRTLVWTGPAHIPLREVGLPEDIPETIDMTFTCLRGEHRDVALNIANLTGAGYPMRMAVADLYNEEHAHAVQGNMWLGAYTVPAMRGAANPGQQFTDALPRLDDAGIVEVRPTGITQIILSLATDGLYPGNYSSRVTLESTLDKTIRRQVDVSLTVLPRQLPGLEDVDITDCYGHIDYAWPAMIALGINTFSISASWSDVAFGDDGSVVYFEKERILRLIERAREEVPDARFMLLNVQGMWRRVTQRQGWDEQDPRVGRAVRSWLQRIGACLREAGVDGRDLIVETWDEPGPGDRALARLMAEWVRQAVPAARTQFYVTSIERDEDWAATAAAHDIVGPIVGACSADNMQFLKSLGTQIWLYDCQAYGETFHPLAYCRLLPWTCRAYGLSGWGQFHWFNTSHGRPYRAWDGVEAQNVVYPSRDGKGWVASRRYLATRAGHEDYAVLKALAQDGEGDDGVTAFIDEACRRALAMAPRRKGYHTAIEDDADPALLDALRAEAVKRLQADLPSPAELAATLTDRGGSTVLRISDPPGGELRIRWLMDGALPWHELRTAVATADFEVVLADRGEVTRCLVDMVAPDGRIHIGQPLPIPTIRVDSTSEAYGSRVLNDGIRAVASKFEPASAWVSSADPVEHWVEMDLGRVRTVQEVRLYWMTFTGLPHKTRIDAQRDSGTWQPVSATPTWRPASGPVDRIRFTPVRTRRLRVVMAPLGGGAGGPALMGLSEVDVR